MWIYTMAMSILGWYVGGAKNRPVLGGVLGVALGFIGVLIMLVVPNKED